MYPKCKYMLDFKAFSVDKNKKQKPKQNKKTPGFLKTFIIC